MDRRPQYNTHHDDIWEALTRGSAHPIRRNRVPSGEGYSASRHHESYNSRPRERERDWFPPMTELSRELASVDEHRRAHYSSSRPRRPSMNTTRHNRDFGGEMGPRGWNQQHHADSDDGDGWGPDLVSPGPTNQAQIRENLGYLGDIDTCGPGHRCLITSAGPNIDIRSRRSELRGHNPPSWENWDLLHTQKGAKDYSFSTYNNPPIHRMPAELVVRMLNNGLMPAGDLAQATERQLSMALTSFMSALTPEERSHWATKSLGQDQILQHKLLSKPFDNRERRELCYFDQKEEELIMDGEIYDAPLAGWVEPAAIPGRRCRTCQGPGQITMSDCDHSYCVPHFRAKVADANAFLCPLVCCERSLLCLKPDFVFANAGWAGMCHLYHWNYAMLSLGPEKLWRCTNRDCSRYVGVKTRECSAAHCPFCWELTCLRCGVNHNNNARQPSAIQASSATSRSTFIPQFLDKELVGQNLPLLERLLREGRYNRWDRYGSWD